MAVSLFAFALLLRLPYFFVDSINWDESTFILVGQSLLDGNLPYTRLWDLKPPLVFAFFACVIGIFGKSIIAVRFAGLICVVATAFITYQIGRKLFDEQTAKLAAVICVVLACGLPHGQATLTEHIALVPLMGALWLLIVYPDNPLRIVLWAGVLIGSAALIRLNLAYAGVGTVLILCFGQKRDRERWIILGLTFATGILVVILTTFIPYLISGKVDLWWQSVVQAPLSFPANSSIWKVAISQGLWIFWYSIQTNPPLFLFHALVWVSGLIGIGILVVKWKALSEKELYAILLFAGMFLGGRTLNT